MTVKCLTKTTQDIICLNFSNSNQIDGLAQRYEVSRRTIIRVLEDHDIDPGIRRRKVKTKPVMTEQLPLIGDPNFQFPDYMINPQQQPGWIKRALNKVVRVFNRT